jgi:hypothetical protein
MFFLILFFNIRFIYFIELSYYYDIDRGFDELIRMTQVFF